VRGRGDFRHLNSGPTDKINKRWNGKYERPRLPALSVLEKSLEDHKHDA
jgi:hypothetical protein